MGLAGREYKQKVNSERRIKRIPRTREEDSRGQPLAHSAAMK